MPKLHFRLFLAALALPVLCACLSSRAAADGLTISNLTAISGQAGDAITVYGDLTNNTDGWLFFSTDSINLNADASVATASDDLMLNAIFGLGPSEIDPGDQYTGVDLFTITLTGGAGTYSGNTFDISGGTDYDACSAGTTGCDDQLGGVVFSFDVNNPGGNPAETPESATWLLLASGLSLAAWVYRRHLWTRATGS